MIQVYNIKNSLNLTSKISSITLPPSFSMVSFDVKNLFPSIPSNECIQLVSEHLSSTHLSDDQYTCIITLLKLCIHQNFFKFNNQCYTQIDGLAMGSNLSPLLAEIFMNNLESNHIATSKFYTDHVIFWGRYVDDVICIHSADDSGVNNFLNELNGIHPNVQFTIEKESNNTLPFLDLLLHKSPQKITFSIYRKPTTTDNMIPYDSVHPITHKMAGLHSLLYRLHNIPMLASHFIEELNIIKQMALNNGYPIALVEKLSRRIKHSINPTRLSPISSHNPNRIYRSLTFYPNISYPIQQIFKHHRIHISFSNKFTLRSSLVKNKDRSNKLESSGIYQLNCHSCPSMYIGQTGRWFSSRIKEHVKSIKNNNFDKKSAFAEHILKTGHDFDPNTNVQILHNCKKGHLLNTLEMFEITRKRDNPGLLNEVVDFQHTLICSLCT
ncbi:hypothetical protein RI129_005913 [Pyrocoelia pectoralis]|uniref:Reverse transcriptase domain-containing protein n=1 Tax=Pyrocoelia pectoralis TaxID=417401 RepID=A0AAN7VG24_9COLE